MSGWYQARLNAYAFALGRIKGILDFEDNDKALRTRITKAIEELEESLEEIKWDADSEKK